MFNRGRLGEERAEQRPPRCERRRTAKSKRMVFEHAPLHGQQISIRRLDRSAQFVRDVAAACGQETDGSRIRRFEIGLAAGTDTDQRGFDDHDFTYRWSIAPKIAAQPWLVPVKKA